MGEILANDIQFVRFENLCYKIIILATNDSEDHDTFNTLLLDDKTLTFFFSILSSILVIHTCGS